MNKPLIKRVVLFLLLVVCIDNSYGQEIKLNAHTLSSHGYLRTGLGRSFDGGEMVQFQAPGAMVKPRFGNEANHYAELQFDYKFQPEGRNDSYEIVYMMATYLPYASEEGTTNKIEPETAQLYFKWNNFYKGLDIWAGRRYYQRENVDILDWFWLNSAQLADVGVGIEQINIGKDKTMDIAVIRFSDDLVDPAIDNKYYEDYKLDVRFKNFKIQSNLDINFLGQLGYRMGIDNTPYKDQNGFALGTWINYTKNHFYNRTSVMYRKGVNMVDNPYSGKGLLEISSTGEQIYNLDKASDLQIVSDFQYDDKTRHGFLGALTYQYKEFGVLTAAGNDKTFSHFNATGRYSYYLSNRFALTLEAGFDHVNQEDAESGSLGKITFSPEIKWNKGMFSRPSIRPFITYATWSEELKGQVGVFNGNNAYADKTAGVTAGLQLEIWW